MRTREGLPVLVRTPANYRAEVAHPLLVVYAGAGTAPRGMERLTGFTPQATRRGYVVAYAPPLRPSRAALRKLATIPAWVAQHYCIDATRVDLSGHSDGGTVATALTLQTDSSLRVHALAPSAAGFTRADLDGFSCPAPRPVRVMHGAKDTLFPGWGKEAWQWWSQCNACTTSADPVLRDGCLVYPDCRAPAYYCEAPSGHSRFPPDGAQATVDFFSANWPTAERAER